MKFQGMTIAAMLALQATGLPVHAAESRPSEKALDAVLATPSVVADELKKADTSWARHIKLMTAESGITGGILESEKPLKKKSDAFRERRGKVSGKEVLDTLVAQNREYKWQAADKAVNVVPQDMTKEPLSLLGRRVERFSIRARYATVAIQALLKKEKFPARSETKHMLGGIRPRSVPDEREFLCESKTVLECMNAFAAQDGSRFWHIYFQKRLESYVVGPSDEREGQ